jgi:hypothetical protein
MSENSLTKALNLPEDAFPIEVHRLDPPSNRIFACGDSRSGEDAIIDGDKSVISEARERVPSSEPAEVPLPSD